ncbi:unnamed protein product, partial [Leptidea sinapis]
MEPLTETSKLLHDTKTMVSPSPSSSKDPKIELKLIPSMMPSPKGVENAKKRLRAFSIQKKSPLTPITAPKPSGSGNTVVLIGKLNSVKVTPKADEQETKPKIPKPPKPGTVRKSLQETYGELQRKTLAEIEDMKRKMELVDLGIPLGLICPTPTSETAMPTKAMPPIKSFIDPAKVDEIIREAKKAKIEGREFKFDYHKLLPSYDNPFQRRKEEDKERAPKEERKGEGKDYRKSDKYSYKRYSDYKSREDKYHREKEKSRDRDRTKDREKEKKSKGSNEKSGQEKETNVNLNDYLVCDSWSLDNDDKMCLASPRVDDKEDPQSSSVQMAPLKYPTEIKSRSIEIKNEILKKVKSDKEVKAKKLQPVMDSFKYEIDDNDDALDMFDDDLNYSKVKTRKLASYNSPVTKILEVDDSVSRDNSFEGVNDDTFLESVINEIKGEAMSDDESQDKGLVEYEISPLKDDDDSSRKSATPEMKSRSEDYSDGYRSSESGYKTSDTIESGYKSSSNFRLSIEKELDDALNASKMSKATLDSLETWTFVLKICQPLLFRHDKNRCYMETRTQPKLWYTISPKHCPCVKDRSVVYEELETCKMSLVDRVYGCDQIAEEASPKCRNWYPPRKLCLSENSLVQASIEWEADDSQQWEDRPPPPEVTLDREYQKFMEAVWPEAMDTKKESSRSTTPVKENRKKKKTEGDEKEKKNKKMKLSSEGWSQESEPEEVEKSKKEKQKEKKPRKRKPSTSLSSSSSSSEDDARKKKALKKKAMKKVKSKSAKRRRMGKKMLKKLKEKKKKKKRAREVSEDESDSDRIAKKSKKKLLEKSKKKGKKKAKVESSSSDTSSSSDSDDKRTKKAKKKQESRKKRRKSSSESEELFDVNILKNIKTERITDDEANNLLEFSPRRQKPREIINVKELQNDFVGNNIHIKTEEKERECVVEEIEERERPHEVLEKGKTGDIDRVDESKKTVQDTKIRATEVTMDDISQCSQDSVFSVKEGSVCSSFEQGERGASLPAPVTAEPVAITTSKPHAYTAEPTKVTSSPIEATSKTKPSLKENELRVSPVTVEHVHDPGRKSSGSIVTPKLSPVIITDPAMIPIPPDAPVAIKADRAEDITKNTVTATIKPVEPPSMLNFSTVVTIPSTEMTKQAEAIPRIVPSGAKAITSLVATNTRRTLPESTEATDECEYWADNYDMCEQMAMEYQSDVADRLQLSGGAAESGGGEAVSRIETVVRARCGEIKCDWRADTAP